MLGSQPWQRVAFLATGLVFIAVATYVYGFLFFSWLESDAAVPALLAAKALQARSPIVTDWYYANGDLWVIAPHLIALVPVAIIGANPISLLIATALGFVLELVVLVKIYTRLAGALWIAVFAAMTTLMAWSNAHVAYEYIQLAYGFLTCLWLVAFYAFAALAQRDRLNAWQLVALAGLVVVIGAANPSRSLVYLIAPVLGACLWPWRDAPIRRRLALASVAIGGWLISYGVYIWLARVVSWSLPRGHVKFAIASVGAMVENLATLARGLLILCARGSGSPGRALPGVLLLVGALTLVLRDVIGTRTSTARRWVCVAVVAQLGVVVATLVVGNLLDGEQAVRYAMPSLIAVVGLATVIACGLVAEAPSSTSRWPRRIAAGWLAGIPLVAVIAASDTRPPRPVPYKWPNASELHEVADELVRQGLTRGFAGDLAANLLTLDSSGAALICRVTTNEILTPQRWLADTSCYTPSTLPDRFFVVVYQNERDRKAIHATLPHELDRFSVGDTYETYVFRTEEASTAWLTLPILDGDLATFPMRVPATYLQLRRGQAAVESGLVATGEPGTVVYGPYLELAQGHYTATWTGNGIESAGQIGFRVTGVDDGGWRDLATPVTRDATRIPRDRTELVRLSFTLKHRTRGIEFTVDSHDGARVALHELLIERAPRR